MQATLISRSTGLKKKPEDKRESMLRRELRSATCTGREEERPKREPDPAAADLKSGPWDEGQPDFGARENGG